MYPAYIHTQTTARNIDHAAIKTYQIPSLILMEHAALKSAEIIEQITNTNQSICILCGPGNNASLSRVAKQMGCVLQTGLSGFGNGIKYCVYRRTNSSCS